jgi:hypothetical protein
VEIEKCKFQYIFANNFEKYNAIKIQGDCIISIQKISRKSKTNPGKTSSPDRV